MFFHICDRFLIDRENTIFRTGLDRHIRDRKTVVHRKTFHSLTRKLQRAVKRAVYSDLADQVKDHVLAADPFAKASG